MKAALTATALALVGSTEAFVAPSAPRAALSPSNSLDTSRGTATAVRATPTMEFAGGLMGADGPEPNSKNFDPLGLAAANPQNVLFFREAEIKVGEGYVACFGETNHGKTKRKSVQALSYSIGDSPKLNSTKKRTC